MRNVAGETYRASRYVKPELSQSQLSFKDLLLNPDTGRVSVTISIFFSSVYVEMWGLIIVLSFDLGTCSPGQDQCLLHFVELQVDSHSWGRSSGPQQTRPCLCLRWITGRVLSKSYLSGREVEIHVP